MYNPASTQRRGRAPRYLTLFFEVSGALIGVPLLVNGLLAVTALRGA